MRGVPALVVQILVSALLLAWLLQKVPLADLQSAIARLKPSTLVAALALTLVSYLGRAQRWAKLLSRAGLRLPLGRAWCLTLLGVGYGLVTPGKVGEFARVLHLGVPRAQALASVVWDRATDVLILEALALPAFVCVPAWRGPVLWLFAAVVAATLGLVALLESRSVQRVVARVLPFAARPLARWQDASAGTLASQAFRAGLAGGAFYYVFNFAAGLLLLRDLVARVPATLLLGFPIIPLLGNLPIAFSGLGLREQVSAALFAPLGAGAASGPAFSLAWFAVATLAPGVLGLLLAPTRWARWSAPGSERA
jgi:uncharacterized membrane protein YbhN (UPF0104 family)